MIFKIGDKVKIREDLSAGKGYFMADGLHYCIASRQMCERAGETATIASVHPGCYLIEGSAAYWSDAMFDKNTKENETSSANFEPGDIVQCIYSSENPLLIGKIGTVIVKNHDCYLVEFNAFVDGTDDKGRGRRGHCWNCPPSHLRIIDRVKESNFKVGDRVECVKCDGPHAILGKTGTVIAHSISKGVPLVEFDEYVNGHNGRARAERAGKDGHCWYCYDNELEIIANEPAETTFNQKVVITSNGKVSMATLYDGKKEVCTATGAMPDGVDFDFMGCAKRALKHLAKECAEPKSPEVAPPLFNGAVVCVENHLDPRAFTIGKTYYAIDGVLLDNSGFRYEPIDWLNDDPNSSFCVYNTVDGPLVKFVVLTDNTKVE